MTAGATLREARIEALSSTLRDAAELLHVKVDQLPRPLTLIADNGTGGAIEAGQDGEPFAPEDTVDSGGSHPQLVGDAMWARTQVPPERADGLDHRLSECVR